MSQETLNPQARQMADESMFRNLAAQASAIWPQEAPLFRRYELPAGARILDAGCGTGEITARLAGLFPKATVLGVDVLEPPLRVARARHGALAPRVSFAQGSVFHLALPDREFDLTVCRHVIQAIPHPERALAELARVTRRGGRIHLLAEDYGMIHLPARTLDPADFWPAAPREFGARTGSDMLVGRRAFAMMRALGLADLTLDYVAVDTLRVPRETFAAIWEAWRDGYADAIGQHTRFTAEEARRHFDDQIATIRDPDQYAAWIIPILSARVP
ncbi:class I SAM-dependent methyltransferase [Anaeromyxobacter sp. PSR-1]|uniref:class I SAM-dependent methyltransferase n=1 Tax=unclassified Anaeromyxobacter TaxID=2620896 RepID=UPI0005DDDE21|nr:class I SAM-dependent methyltransferase [Anaeromyxobacter sp. PSR-1]GAO02494.1 putative protein [Anaeromyxobacter sp. PSR-1]